MNKVWQVFNSPLIVVLVALAVWPIMAVVSGGIAAKLGLQQITNAVSEEVVKPLQKYGDEQDKKLRRVSGILEKLEITNVRNAKTSWSKSIKIIGTVTNRSESTVKSIRLLVSSYRGKELVNVDHERLSHISLLKPGTSTNFAITLRGKEDQDPREMRFEIKVSNLEILD